MENIDKKGSDNSKGNRGVQSKGRYVAAFLIGTGVFILVFVLANFISYLEFQRITTMQGKTAYGIFESKLDYNFFSDDVCSQEALTDISQQLGFQGAIIDDLERKLGKHDSNVLFQKKFYTLVELEHLDFILEYNEQCNATFNTIMFFYSNKPGNSGNSEETGRLLDSVYSKYSDSVRIYSFDVNLDSTIIEKLKLKYNITEAPTIVINQNTSLINPGNMRQIETYLD